MFIHLVIYAWTHSRVYITTHLNSTRAYIIFVLRVYVKATAVDSHEENRWRVHVGDPLAIFVRSEIHSDCAPTRRITTRRRKMRKSSRAVNFSNKSKRFPVFLFAIEQISNLKIKKYRIVSFRSEKMQTFTHYNCEVNFELKYKRTFGTNVSHKNSLKQLSSFRSCWGNLLGDKSISGFLMTEEKCRDTPRTVFSVSWASIAEKNRVSTNFNLRFLILEVNIRVTGNHRRSPDVLSRGRQKAAARLM